MLPDDLDALPRLNAFRLRGMEMTRLETFVDATFAFAITTLVIAGERAPDNLTTLLAAFANVPAFAASIASLAIFWRGHWLWSRRYGLEDGASVVISWAMIFTMLVYVYPLKLVFSAMFYALSGRRVGHAIMVTSALQARELFALYALGFIAISAEIMLLYGRAWQLRDALRLNAQERFLTRRQISGWSIPTGVGVLSLFLAMFLPARLIAWSGWIYYVFAILTPLHRMRTRQLARSLPA